MRYDLLLRGGAVVRAGGVEVLSVGVAEGRIVALAPELGGDAREVIDACGLVVLPGVVDAHVHFNDPGRAEWEGAETGSAALAAGGGTCFFDMPLNAHPPTLDGPSFDAKRAALTGRCGADFGLWGGLVPGPLDRLDELAARGAIGFKAFLSDAGLADFPRADDLTLLDGMRRAAALGLPVAVHAENEAITAGLAARARGEGRTGVRDFLASRPVVAEVEAIRRVLTLAEETGCALHVVHVSTGAGIAAVAEARARGVDVTAEVCAHHLALTDEDAERLGAVAKCAPPLRPRAEVEALWTHVAAGRVDTVASDHSPAPAALKTSPDFFAVWGGIAGVQSTLSVLLADGHLGRGLPLPDIARLLSETPAARFRIPHKGRIAEGFDADFALVDLAAARPLRAEDLWQRHPSSPYVGRRVHGFVRRTILRGVTVFDGARPTGARPGRLVRPE